MMVHEEQKNFSGSKNMYKILKNKHFAFKNYDGVGGVDEVAILYHTACKNIGQKLIPGLMEGIGIFFFRLLLFVW